MLSIRFRKGLTLSLAVLFLLSFAIGSFFTISLIGYNKIFSALEQYTSISSTHTVEIGIDENNQTTIKNLSNNEPLKIMQVTDMHITCGIATFQKDKMAFDAVYRAIEQNRPDLIVVTGDAIYPSLFVVSSNNDLQARAVGEFFERVGIYWTLVYGNHDANALLTTATKSELSAYYSSLEYCLFETGEENLTGEGNYVIKALNNDGSLNKVLVFMDSNAYIPFSIRKYDRIQDDQIEWYENTLNAIADTESKAVNQIYSLLFFHIPLSAYRTALELYEQDSDEVILHFGKAEERVSPAWFEEDFFSTITNLGSTRATFVGHDHLNNFCLEYEKVLLTYGMSIDYTAYIGIQNRSNQRGVTMICLNEDEAISVAQAPQDNDFKVATVGYNLSAVSP